MDHLTLASVFKVKATNYLTKQVSQDTKLVQKL